MKSNEQISMGFLLLMDWCVGFFSLLKWAHLYEIDGQAA